MGIGTFTIAELGGHGVTLTIALVRTPENRLQYVVTAKRFRAVLPYCGCDRKACTGPGAWGRKCKESEAKGAAGYTHNRDHCHGSMGGWHEEHAQVYAEAVLATFGPKGRAKAKRTIGKSSYRPQDFLPLEGEQATVIVPFAHGGTRQVVCDAARCRDGRGRAAVLTETSIEDHAYRVRNEHIEWHRQFGEHPRVALDRWITEQATTKAPESEPAAEAAA